MDNLDHVKSELQAQIGRLLPEPVRSLSLIGRGKNSRVYKLDLLSGRTLAVKAYYHPGGSNTRLHTEFGALTFMQDHGITCIPAPLLADEEHGFMLFEYIEGARIPTDTVMETDIMQAVDLLASLRALADEGEGTSLEPASEACFSLQNLVSNLEHRLKRIERAPGNTPLEQGLQNYLDHEFVPAFRDMVHWSTREAHERGISFGSEISAHEKTISPSDFGFHNALRLPDERLVFLDFEHFGWDEPAKMIVDFMLHPAMALNQDKCRFFLHSVLSLFPGLPALKDKVELFYPLLGLKWSLIFLNEFVPEDRARRYFAGDREKDLSEMLELQLGKARGMTHRIMEEFGRFP